MPSSPGLLRLYLSITSMCVSVKVCSCVHIILFLSLHKPVIPICTRISTVHWQFTYLLLLLAFRTHKDSYIISFVLLIMEGAACIH